MAVGDEGAHAELTGEREPAAVVVLYLPFPRPLSAELGNRSPVRIDDDVRLVRVPELQIGVAHPNDVSLFATLADAAVTIVGQDVSRGHDVPHRDHRDRQRHGGIRALERHG